MAHLVQSFYHPSLSDKSSVLRCRRYAWVDLKSQLKPYVNTFDCYGSFTGVIGWFQSQPTGYGRFQILKAIYQGIGIAAGEIHNWADEITHNCESFVFQYGCNHAERFGDITPQILTLWLAIKRYYLDNHIDVRSWTDELNRDFITLKGSAVLPVQSTYSR